MRTLGAADDNEDEEMREILRTVLGGAGEDGPQDPPPLPTVPLSSLRSIVGRFCLGGRRWDPPRVPEGGERERLKGTLRRQLARMDDAHRRGVWEALAAARATAP